MPRFFVSPEQIHDGHAEITGEDLYHISKVLRMGPGEELTISDGIGRDYYCKITGINSERIMLDVISSWASFSELPVRIHLYQGLPKAGKMDTIIQKAVELGAVRIVPVQTARSIAKLDESREAKKLSHWQAVAESAAKQAGRSIIPAIASCRSFEEAVRECAGLDAALIPYEKAEGMDQARQIVRSLHGCKDIGILIGPEGGFAPSEVEMAEAAGIRTISLGHRILRTETAGMTMISILMFELETDQLD